MMALITSYPGKGACIVLTLTGMGVCCYSFVIFDRLVRSYYTHYRTEWERAGSPYGFFWSAPESSAIISRLSRDRLAFIWLFRTPPWIAASSANLALLRRFRICVIIHSIIWLILVAFYISSR
jgi:hypothetical protein